MNWSLQLRRLIGVDDVEPSLERLVRAFDEADRDEVSQLIERVGATRDPCAFERSIHHRRRGRIDLLARVGVATLGREATSIHGILQDVTAFNLRLREARATAASYRRLADNAADVIARIGLDGVMRYVSPSVLAVFGYTPEQMIDLPSADFVYPDDLPLTAALFERLRAGETEATLQHRVMHRAGHVVWVETRTRVVEAALTGAHEIVTVARDITQTKALEAELRLAREEAEAGAQAKEDFLANMSHELRTPLNSLVGFSGLVAQAPELSQETRRRAELVSDAGRSLIVIVNDILDVAKIQAEGVALNLERSQVEDLLISAIALVRDEAARCGVGLSVEILRPSCAVMLDPARVRQVLLNLLGNALKFTPRGGRVTLTLDEDSARLIRVQVRDTGVGIPPDRLDQIFSRFAQADSTTSRRYGGTGLGLTISRSIVEAMGGQIVVESVLGVGSTFTFTLRAPRAAAPAAALSAERAEPSVNPGAVSGRRLLLADDNDINRDLFRALTADRGFEIYEAADGLAAVELVKSTDLDLVLMDVQMPVMDGLSAARAIRAAGYDLPIIALTANVMQPQIDLCLAAGMNGHLGKPFGARELAATIERWAPAAAKTAPTVAVEVLEDLAGSLGRDGLVRFLERFAKQLHDIGPLLNDEGGPPSELGVHAHKVRGLAANLGFLAVDQELHRLELACARDVAPSGAALEAARRATRAALAEIERRVRAIAA